MKLVLIVFFSLLVNGCVTDRGYEAYLQVKSVDKRASERMQALVAKKYEVSYRYFLKSYRDVVSYNDYVSTLNSRIIWQGFDIMKTVCEDDICKVDIKVEYRVPPMFGFPQGSDVVENIKETWMRQDGEWFYLPPK